MAIISENLTEAYFLRELKNRFLCEVEVKGKLFECYVPSSCRLSNFLELDGKPVLLKQNISPKGRTKYALVAIPYKRSYILLNSSFANRVVEDNIHKRQFSFLEKRTIILKEYYIEDYKADLFVVDSNTIVEIKSVISINEAAIFPKVYSERAIKQLTILKSLLQKGYKACYIIISLN